jgi:glycosyltransferase involved in cell wall biosynthesis
MLLCVASVTPRKGHDVLVEALARVRHLAWSCTCAGSLDRDRHHADRVLAAVERVGLGDRIAFVGEREGPALEAHYHGASSFVLASYYEGYGMALADAIAHGLPVVSTTGGAIPYTVSADVGLLVPPGDAGALAHALASLLDPAGDTRAKLASAAWAHARGLPTWRSAAAEFARAVRGLAG